MKNKGIGFVGALQVAFIVLKLCGVINWEWVYVLLPAIIDISLSIVLFVIWVVLEIIID